MATVQETIDNLISYIDAAVAKHSVSNRHVATVLEFLNSELKRVREELVQMEELYISKTKDDVAHGLITFVKGLLSLGDITIGDFLDTGDSIQGAQITKEGFGSFAGLKSPYMEIFELILNKQTATGGEFRISDVGTIEDVTYLFEGRESISFADYDEAVHGRPYGALLVLREEYEGYITTFKYDDIVYGYVNRIGESGAYARYGQFYGVVKEVMGDRTLRVLIYSDSQVPTTVNLLPVPYMVITQRGNETDTTRQSVITLSSPDKNMVILHGVDSPILAADGSCYGVSLGRLPDVLYDYVVKAYPYLAREDMSMYVKNLIVQNLMRIDHLGKAIKDERYRGVWSKAVANGTVEGEDKYRVMSTTYDSVTHNGSKWQCQKDGSTVEPSDTTTEWSLIVSKGANGTSVTSGTPEYAVGESGTTAPTSGWNTVPPFVGEGKYLWTRMPFKDGSGTTYAYSVSKNGESVKIKGFKYTVTTSADEPADDAFTTEKQTAGEGEYLWVMTIFSDDNKVKTYSYQGMDNSAVEYTLQPNVTTIYFHDDTTLSTESINLTVKKTTSKGVTLIDDDAVLKGEGFKLQYTYDGVLDDRKDLVLNPTTVLLEDGSELLLEDGSAAELEFTVDDIRNVKNYIEFYLVKSDTEEIWSTCTVAVVRDGKDGNSPYTIIATPPTINVLVDANDDTLPVIGTKSFAVRVSVKKGQEAVSTDAYKLSRDDRKYIGGSSSSIVLRSPSKQGEYWTMGIQIQGGATANTIPTVIRLGVTDNEGNRIGYADVTPSISQRGLTGSAGEVGPLLFPAGYLEFGKAYSLVMYGDRVAAQPFYYHQTDEQKEEGIEGTYYVLQKAISAAENTLENLGNVNFWRPFENIKYLFTEALMANWAKLAKFIFYAEFMFSQQGTNISGDEGLDWSSVAERMFVKDEDGNIIGWTGEFIPNTMIDALRGIISCGKFIEQFDYFTSGNIYRIDLNKAHNVYIPYKEVSLFSMYYVSQFNSYPNKGINDTTSVNDGRIGYYTVQPGAMGNSAQQIWYKYYKRVSPARFVTLPEFSEEMASQMIYDPDSGETVPQPFWLEDGTHVCIMHELSTAAMNPEQDESGNTDFESPVIVFPDNSVLDISNYRATNSSGKYEMGGYNPSIESYFVWRGIRVSAVILAPGTMLKLRSSHVKYNEKKNIRLWYVENSSDFDVTAMTLNVGVTDPMKEVSGTAKVDFHLDPIGWRDYGRTVIGSCMMNQTLRKTSISVYDKDLAYKDTIKTTLYNIYPHALYADENSAMTYTLSFNGVTVADDGSITMNDDGTVECSVSSTALVNTLDKKKAEGGDDVGYTGATNI